jgi:hypothetical protein
VGEIMANGYRRYPYYGGPQASPGYNPYSKHPDWASGIRELLKNMMMMKQMKGEKEERLQERKWKKEEAERARQRQDWELRDRARERWGEEKSAQEKLRLDKEAKDAFGEDSKEYKQWKFFGRPLSSTGSPNVSWLKYKDSLERMSSPRGEHIKGIISDINRRINAYTRNPFYGTKRAPELDKKVGNLNSALNFYRGIQAVGTERKLEKEEWANVLKASDLDKVEQAGRFWEKKTPTEKPSPTKKERVEIGGLGTGHLSLDRKLLFFKGKVIKRNPDGTFTIGVKNYKLE